MKIAITGATVGIGLALKGLLENEGHTVLNLSRSSQCDIASHRPRILALSDGCDVFVNNAFSSVEMFAQTEMLYDVFAAWQNSDRTIVNVSSNSSDGIKTFPHKYAVAKAALDKAAEQLANVGARCLVSNIRLGLVDTPRGRAIRQPDQPILSELDAAQVIRDVILSPRHLLFKTVTAEPR